MSEEIKKVEETEGEKVENTNQPAADDVLNGHIVDKKEKESFGKKLMKPIKWIGRKVKKHPVETALGVTGIVLGVFGAQKAYEYGHSTGYSEGYDASKAVPAIEAPVDELDETIPDEVENLPEVEEFKEEVI